jgi:hypothetical protein
MTTLNENPYDLKLLAKRQERTAFRGDLTYTSQGATAFGGSEEMQRVFY